jgi:dihydrofolate synthase/folylpolyglutamate synthase
MVPAIIVAEKRGKVKAVFVSAVVLLAATQLLFLTGAGSLAGLAAARWPGRLETRRFRGVPLLLDGAHNPPAAVVLRHELNRLGGGGRTWLIGIQRHKDGAAVLRSLLGPEDRALIVPIPDHRAWSLDELAAACPELAGQLASALELEHGLQQLSGAAAAMSLPGSALPVVAGSLYLLGAVMPLLDPLPARSPAPTDAAGPDLGS